MSMIYENENKEVCVQLCGNYILIMNNDKSSILKVTNKNGKSVIETIKNIDN